MAVVATLGVAGANLTPARVEQHRAVLDALVEPPTHRALRLAPDGRDHLDDDPAALWWDLVPSLLGPLLGLGAIPTRVIQVVVGDHVGAMGLGRRIEL